MSESIPEGWNSNCLENLVGKITSGGTPKVGTQDYYGGDIPFLKIRDLTNCSKFAVTSEETITEKAVSESNAKVFPTGTIVTTMYGTIGVTRFLGKPMATNQAIAAFLELKGILPEFLLQVINHDAEKLSSFSSQTTQANISATVLKQHLVLTPPLPEQKKIASILASVDEVIEKTQLQIDKLLDLKKGTMNELFINYIAKTGLKDNRKSFLLSNLVSRIRTIENNEVKNILTISSTRGWLEQSERWSRKMAGESLKKYTKLKKGDFSYNRGNSKTFPYGCIFRMDKWDEAVVPNVYHSFEITNVQVDSNYLQQYFWSGALDKQLRKVLTSSARDDGLLNITADTFFSLNVDLPSLSEQKKVASILTSMDKTIEDKEQKLAQTQSLKKSLMQDLLTGIVRVTVN